MDKWILIYAELMLFLVTILIGGFLSLKWDSWWFMTLPVLIAPLFIMIVIDVCKSK